MQFQVCESDDSCQPGAQYTNPRVVVEEHHGAPLLNCSGLVLVRQLIERLGVARAIDAGVRVLQRCKWYRESDHILTLIYSMISGGSRLQDVNRLGQDDALKRVLGSDRIPHATTFGKFLWRFGDDQQDKQRQGLAELRDTTAAIQQDAFAMLPRERRKVATLDWDSSIHEVYGQKKEGADFAYDNTWSYSASPSSTGTCTGPWRRPAMCCIWGCGKAIGTPATGQGSAAGNDRTGEQALSAGADARRQRLPAKRKICEQSSSSPSSTGT